MQERVEVRSQAEFDAAIAAGKWAIVIGCRIDVRASVAFEAGADARVDAWRSSAPRVEAWGSSAPRVVAWESSAPRVVARDSSAPRVVAWGSSAPRVEARDSSAPRVVAWGSSAPRVDAWGYAQIYLAALGGKIVATASRLVSVLIRGEVSVSGGRQTVIGQDDDDDPAGDQPAASQDANP